jgi:pyruvate dehydrogenase phosphatase
MTATADIQYRSHDATRHRFLVLASDGLTDLFSNAGGPPVFDQTIADKWATALGDASERPDQNNLALALLRTGLGGSDLDKCSKCLTVESKERLIDDTTVIVHKF